MTATRLTLGTATLLVAVLAAPVSASAAPTHHVQRGNYGIGSALTIHRAAHHPATFGIGTAITIHR